MALWSILIPLTMKPRQTILHQLLSYLDEQLNYVNESRKRDGKRSIQLDYA